LSSIQKQQIKYLGVDAGGTFTDFVLFSANSWQIHKVLSTPDNPAFAILQGINELGLNTELSTGALYIVHGSTVATNAALERKGARTVYVANKGFKDILTIGRQARQELYNLFPKPTPAPVPKDLCLEVDTRRDANGKLIQPLSEQSISKLVKQIDALSPEAVAINLLFSFLDSAEEERIEEALKSTYFTSRSSFVLPKYKEYERGIATWLNASLGPKVNRYMETLIARLEGCPISVMQSTGGTMEISQAANRAVNLLLSGPAGGLSAVRSLSKQSGLNKIISFDMGGTSTDVALMNGDFTLTDEGTINHWPIAVPMLDIITIGAGGGSIAWQDQGGMLHVGPQSAGSNPGPACYDNGGTDVTVTDANVILGRLLPNGFLNGTMRLNPEKSAQAAKSLSKRLGISPAEVAHGIIKVAEHQMIQALNRISIKKGHNPADFVLCCFGGAGGLHVCSLAEQLKMKQAIVPMHSGVLSAAGMLTAPKQRQLTITRVSLWTDVLQTDLDKAFYALEARGISSLNEEAPGHPDINIQRSVDLRYQGQSYTLNVPYTSNSAQHFIDVHAQQFGHKLNHPVELVNLCVDLSIESTITPPALNFPSTHPCPYQFTKTSDSDTAIPVFDRSSLNNLHALNGPLLITEHVSTTWLKKGWSCRLDDFGNLLLIMD
jgi:N-methylhydantoinase A